MTAAGALVAHGRSADVYEYGDAHVVKVFHATWPAAAVDREIRDTASAYHLGLSPVRCYGEIEVDGRRGVVLDRVRGRALTTVAERNPLLLPRVGRELAAIHARLHATVASTYPDVRELAAILVDTSPFGAFTAGERAGIRTHLAALPEGEAPLHLDFHPMNVFEHHDGHAVIDWQSTATGDPAADVAMTRLLFTEAELFPGASRFQILLYGAGRRAMGAFYLREYLRRTGMDIARVDRWTTAARVLRLGLLDIESERERMVAGIRAGIAGAGA